MVYKNVTLFKAVKCILGLPEENFAASHIALFYYMKPDDSNMWSCWRFTRLQRPQLLTLTSRSVFSKFLICVRHVTFRKLAVPRLEGILVVFIVTEGKNVKWHLRILFAAARACVWVLVCVRVLCVCVWQSNILKTRKQKQLAIH